jgi:hypothetical protein
VSCDHTAGDGQAIEAAIASKNIEDDLFSEPDGRFALINQL